jgi:hypothetical protein
VPSGFNTNNVGWNDSLLAEDVGNTTPTRWYTRFRFNYATVLLYTDVLVTSLGITFTPSDAS